MSNHPSILVTGGAQRIGLHCAQRLIEDGHRVIISCRALDAERAAAIPAGAEILLADFSTVAGIQGLIDQLHERSVSLRAIIHNASVWLDDQQGPDALQQMFMVHMQAPYMINSQCAALFCDEQVGDIIHLGDDVTRKGSAKHIAYCASKAGLEGLSRSFAAQLAPRIKVNCINPALVMFNESDDATYRSKALAKSAMGLEPGPEVVYQTIRYLLDNPYITGSTLPLNGGRHLK
jgi:dihydromonapterin reductase / dihydrofolate reductase